MSTHHIVILRIFIIRNVIYYKNTLTIKINLYETYKYFKDKK